ncbi:threonine synthase [Desulfococcaceae bacterium HSG9]|nr:threonine synthase [Desulfococcaceae bacterium HSG9]
MELEQFPQEIRSYIFPKHKGDQIYRCLACGNEYEIKELLYTCPSCGQVFLIYDRDFDQLKQIDGAVWRKIFDYRKMLSIPELKGIYLYHEFIGPTVPLDAVVYLGEAHTPMIEANRFLQEKLGVRFFVKNDGQNPSASFKDRGMASALSYINYLIKSGAVSDILAVCASTGDTSAAAALYASYLQPHVKSAVLLPHKKVTPQQLSQPLGSGARVFEIPGVFDDCMKVVEALSERYNVALLNSKNAWRILGQETYSYEIAQDFEYDMDNKAIVLPIGNAGNITAVMSGFIKFYETGIIKALPKIIGVQSQHANPVFRYYAATSECRQFVPVTVKPSVAQAAMIGNPVSMPRVIHLAELYNRLSGRQNVFVVEVTEQAIMEWELTANRNGHITCTQGGESLAGLAVAQKLGIIDKNETAIIDSTAHALKFSGFQEMYFARQFPSEFGISYKSDLINAPVLIETDKQDDSLQQFIDTSARAIAVALNLKTKELSKE